MSKLVKFFAIAALISGALAMTPAPAAAQHHHGGGHWHGERARNEGRDCEEFHEFRHG